jgi:valyl-tRNA synthetase
VFAQGGQPAGEFPAYGADALRWGLLAMSSGQDVKFSEDKLVQGQQLTNKLWNAARLILLGVGGEDSAARAAATPRAPEDRWILSRLQRARTEVHARIERYDFSHAALAVYDFIYGELCDWYLELIKPRLRDGEPDLAATLLYVLTETVALAHPLIPFETEEIYGHIPGAEGLLAGRVNDEAAPVDERAETEIGNVIAAVQTVRTWRDTAGVKAGTVVPAKLAAAGYETTAEHLARLGRVSLANGGESNDTVATVPIPGGALEILAGDGFDAGAAREKLGQRRAKLEAEIERAERKLANAGFLANAPPDVVRAEHEKLERLSAELEAL